jgi:transcriptional activator SPT7
LIIFSLFDNFYRFSNISLDVYPELQFPTYGLTPLIDKSNKALEQVRLMYAKCNAIRNNIPVIKSTLNYAFTFS